LSGKRAPERLIEATIRTQNLGSGVIVPIRRPTATGVLGHFLD